MFSILSQAPVPVYFNTIMNALLTSESPEISASDFETLTAINAAGEAAAICILQYIIVP